MRRRLLAGTALLAAVQLAHLVDVLRYDDNATFPRVLADPLALVGIGGATYAFVALALGRPAGVTAALVAGATVAAGFVIVHGLPAEVGINNPYWTPADGNRADAIRWATVIGAIGIGAWTAWTAWSRPIAETSSRM